MIKNVIFLAAISIFSIAKADGIDQCKNPKQCFYFCQNGWAYDLDAWYLSCFNEKRGWQETVSGPLAECNSTIDKIRDYCNPPKSKRTTPAQ